MNQWIVRSIEIASSPGYLDKLSEIYPVTLDDPRDIPLEVIEEIRYAYDKKDKVGLVRLLLDLKKFPIKDPFVAFLRREAGAIEKNPATMERLADTLLEMGFEKVLAGATAPKEFNTTMGPLLANWLRRLPYPFLGDVEIQRHDGIAFLEGSESMGRVFADEVLGCNLKKNPDFVAKAKSVYVLGEGKFLTERGGHQDRQIDDALGLLEGRDGKALRVAVLDGVCWLPDKSDRAKHSMYQKITKRDSIILSALLLEEFLQSLA